MHFYSVLNPQSTNPLQGDSLTPLIVVKFLLNRIPFTHIPQRFLCCRNPPSLPQFNTNHATQLGRTSICSILALITQSSLKQPELAPGSGRRLPVFDGVRESEVRGALCRNRAFLLLDPRSPHLTRLEGRLLPFPDFPQSLKRTPSNLKEGNHLKPSSR